MVESGVMKSCFCFSIFFLNTMLFNKGNAKRVRVSSACGQTTLGPYEPDHVVEYNFLMKDPQLQELTGSEPLSLEEEFDMQREWHSDPEKLCLLIFSADGTFAGDVNAFFREEDEDGHVVCVAEVSVMIARSSERQKGHASRALKLLFDQVLAKLEQRPVKLEARIKLHNEPSIALFRKLGFVEESVSEAFGEVTMVLCLK